MFIGNISDLRGVFTLGHGLSNRQTSAGLPVSRRITVRLWSNTSGQGVLYWVHRAGNILKITANTRPEARENIMHTQGKKNEKQKNQSQTGHSKEPETLDDLLNFYNMGLEDETWQRIVRALAARGFPVTDDDWLRGKR